MITTPTSPTGCQKITPNAKTTTPTKKIDKRLLLIHRSGPTLLIVSPLLGGRWGGYASVKWITGTQRETGGTEPIHRTGRTESAA